MALAFVSSTPADATFSATGTTVWNAGMDTITGGAASTLVFVNAGNTALDLVTGWTFDGTNKVTAAAGTITTGGSQLVLTQTRNAAGTTFDPVIDITVTDSASAAASLVERIRGGASGTTVLRTADKSGNHVLGGSIQTGISGTSSLAAIRINHANSGMSLQTVSGVANGWGYADGSGGEWAGLAQNRQGTFTVRSDGGYGFSSGFNVSNAPDLSMRRAGANAISFDGGAAVSTPTGLATSEVTIRKAVTAFTDGVAKATFTVTIPNAAHSGSIRFKAVGSIGAGGAIGANEATGTVEYDISIARTAGVNAVANISAAYGSATSAVAGATTITVAAALSAISGAVGATNTFTIDVTITKGGGSSDNHTCMVYAELLNANATGITIA